MYLYKRVCIISQTIGRYLCKTVCFKINSLSFSKFYLECLNDNNPVFLIRSSYKKLVNSTFNADRNTFLANKTVRLVSGLYVLIDARNKNFEIVYCSMKNTD